MVNHVFYIYKKYLGLLALLSVITITLFACGGGSSDSDPGTPTTLTTPSNGESVATTFTRSKQFILPLITYAANVTTLTQAATAWTNTSTNIITLSQIPYVTGSKSARDYASAGSVFSMTTDTVAGTRSFSGNGLPSTTMGTFPVQ